MTRSRGGFYAQLRRHPVVASRIAQIDDLVEQLRGDDVREYLRKIRGRTYALASSATAGPASRQLGEGGGGGGPLSSIDDLDEIRGGLQHALDVLARLSDGRPLD